MHIITVSGSHSGVGKTTLAVLIIARLAGYAAIKVTVTDLFVSVTDDPARIGVEGKDTALMRDAGASPVIWVQGPPDELGEALSHALSLAGGAKGVVIEGNSPARLVRPDAAFFVAGKDVTDLKPGALDVLAGADGVVVNVEDDEPPEEARGFIRRHNPGAVITTMGRMRRPDGPLDGLLGRLG